MRRFLTLAALCLALPAGAQEDTADPRPYIFTQAHAGSTQPVPAGAGIPVQVQLPGNPALWVLNEAGTRNAEFLGRTMVFSPGRIDGTESVFVFDFRLTGERPAQIVIGSANPPEATAELIEHGVYVIELTAPE